ncbi:MAG: hypothetical protein QM709_02600 [Spongiibacteraceae bacterium]
MTAPETSACDCNDTLDAQRLNTYCLCPQEPSPTPTGLQIAAVPVFLPSADIERMSQLIGAIESVVHSDRWQRKVLATAPDIAQRKPGNAGVLYGYDFHLSADGPKLIEINTNAGGALIVAQVLRTQSGCCTDPAMAAPACQAQQAEDAIVDSLLDDFAMARGHREPRSIAIVDINPTAQYLYPEFLRFAELLRARGFAVAIADPSELIATNDGLILHGKPVDLIYNRLTDFYLEDESLAALRRAYENDQVVVTPNPHHHALYADKRHLALLSDASALDALHIDNITQGILLNGIPQTRVVDAAHAKQLWAERKTFFFKPATAYGGKGAYRGAKLTRGTFEQLLHDDYVAQREVEPTLRNALVDGETIELKVDVRCYVYRGKIQLTAARLWRGQTTNFRTAGGGFATITRTAS